jgi:hypothetical protein
MHLIVGCLGIKRSVVVQLEGPAIAYVTIAVRQLDRRVRLLVRERAGARLGDDEGAEDDNR